MDPDPPPVDHHSVDRLTGPEGPDQHALKCGTVGTSFIWTVNGRLIWLHIGRSIWRTQVVRQPQLCAPATRQTTCVEARCEPNCATRVSHFYRDQRHASGPHSAVHIGDMVSQSTMSDRNRSGIAGPCHPHRDGAADSRSAPCQRQDRACISRPGARHDHAADRTAVGPTATSGVIVQPTVPHGPADAARQVRWSTPAGPGVCERL